MSKLEDTLEPAAQSSLSTAPAGTARAPSSTPRPPPVFSPDRLSAHPEPSPQAAEVICEGPLTFSAEKIALGDGGQALKLRDHDFRRLANARGALDQLDDCVLTLSPGVIALNREHTHAQSLVEKLTAVPPHELIAAVLLIEAVPPHDPAAHRIVRKLSGYYEDRQRLVEKLEPTSTDLALAAIDIPLIAEPLRRGWRYSQETIRSADRAVAPLNPNFLALVVEHKGDPRAVFQAAHGGETPTEQSAVYQNYLMTKSDPSQGIQRAWELVRAHSPLFIPKEARFGLAPYMRGVDSDRQSHAYPQFSVEFRGEYVDNRSRAGNQILYSVRFHTNTQQIAGKPPLIVVNRTCWGKPEILLLPYRHLGPIRAHPVYGPAIRTDASGNQWLSEKAHMSASLARGSQDQAEKRLGHSVMEATHHPAWKESLHT